MDKEQIRHIGFLLSHIGKFIHLRLNKILKENGYEISMEQLSILTALTHKEGINQQELSEMTFRDKTTILRNLDCLEGNHLVERVHDTKDRRNNLIYLTEKGKADVSQSSKFIGKISEHIFNNISQDDINKFEEILDKLFENVKPEFYNIPTYESVLNDKEK